jgi:hypothetical protein
MAPGRDWIKALSTYFRDHDKTPVNVRLAAYNSAMEQLAQLYPDDYEAQAFYALTLQAIRHDLCQPAQVGGNPRKVVRSEPAASGRDAFHHHAYDYHPLAEKGIPAARRYATIAPAVPHARHMPSHIYSMVGLWEESIASNASALAIQPDCYHAADFSVYAHLQLAQDAKAKALMEKSVAMADRGDRPVTFVNFTAKNAMSAPYVLERADWAGAAALPFTSSQYPQPDSLIRFGGRRAATAARSAASASLRSACRSHSRQSAVTRRPGLQPNKRIRSRWRYR